MLKLIGPEALTLLGYLAVALMNKFLRPRAGWTGTWLDKARLGLDYVSMLKVKGEPGLKIPFTKTSIEAPTSGIDRLTRPD